MVIIFSRNGVDPIIIIIPTISTQDVITRMTITEAMEDKMDMRDMTTMMIILEGMNVKDLEKSYQTKKIKRGILNSYIHLSHPFCLFLKEEYFPLSILYILRKKKILITILCYPFLILVIYIYIYIYIYGSKFFY